MDPNANLEEMLKLAKLLEGVDGIGVEELDPRTLDKTSRLAELVLDLDGWLSKGGFLPEKWERCSACVEADLTPDLCEHSRGEG